MEFKQSQREWEDLAELDPLWAILSNTGKRGGGWQDEEFDESGRVEADGVMLRAAALGLPRRWRTALDFGCGIGRLSRPLAESFDRCIGLDISERDDHGGAQAERERLANLEFEVNACEMISRSLTQAWTSSTRGSCCST